VLSSWFRFSFAIALAALSASLAAGLPFSHGEHWTELNIGPFHVDTQGDIREARDALTQVEQVRWVLSGLLEVQDLQSIWPIRVVFTKEDVPAQIGFEWQNGQYLLVCRPGTHVPLDSLAGILLDANTPRLPAEVDSGLRQLFSTLEAHGSRVTWGGAPAHPDLAWARMQLFATKFEYGASFHIFLAALKDGATIRAAETNAFAKPEDALEEEAAANLASHNWQAVPVSGRPLDPKRDFGEQPLAAEIAGVYIADAELRNEPHAAESAYKSAIEAGGTAAALGFEGLAQSAKLDKQDPLPFLEKAMGAGTKSAPVYVAAAQEMPPEKALPLLKKAAQLNPRWAEPVYIQAKLAANPHGREDLLKKAIQLDPRATAYWVELAHVETTNGEASAAQGSWLRAEQSAPTNPERDRIHQMRIASEEQRLDAEEAAVRRERESAHEVDERAQDAETARIQAAEQQADQAVDAAGGEAQPEKVVPWSQTVPHKKLAGALIAVDCLHTATRISIKERSGRVTQLLLSDPSRDGLACGPQRPSRRALVVYAAQPNDSFHTAGSVISVHVQ
jgi:hypothetical protein